MACVIIGFHCDSLAPLSGFSSIDHLHSKDGEHLKELLGGQVQ